MQKRDTTLLEQLAIRLDPTHHRCMNAYSKDLRKKIVEGRGCELLYLPPYSPNLNPIERAFAKLKGRLRAGLRPAPARRS